MTDEITPASVDQPATIWSRWSVVSLVVGTLPWLLIFLLIDGLHSMLPAVFLAVPLCALIGLITGIIGIRQGRYHWPSIAMGTVGTVIALLNGLLVVFVIEILGHTVD